MGLQGATILFLVCLLAGWLVLLLMRRYPKTVSWAAYLPLPPKITGFLQRFLLSLVGHLTMERLV